MCVVIIARAAIIDIVVVCVVVVRVHRSSRPGCRRVTTRDDTSDCMAKWLLGLTARRGAVKISKFWTRRLFHVCLFYSDVFIKTRIKVYSVMIYATASKSRRGAMDLTSTGSGRTARARASADAAF